MSIFKQGVRFLKTINNEKLGQLYTFSLKKVLIVYLKKGAIRHTQPTMSSIDSYIPLREYLWSIIALILTNDFVFYCYQYK